MGLVGNLASVFVLSMEEMKNCFNYLLISLAMFDMVFILLVTMDYSFVRGLDVTQISPTWKVLLAVLEWPFDTESKAYTLLFPKVIYPINNISFTCSTFTTIIIAYER